MFIREFTNHLYEGDVIDAKNRFAKKHEPVYRIFRLMTLSGKSDWLVALQTTDPVFLKDKLQRLIVPVQRGVEPVKPEDLKVSKDGEFIAIPELNIVEATVEEGTRCWKGYKKKGMKTMFGKRVPNCVKNEDKDVPCPACGDPKCDHKEDHLKEAEKVWITVSASDPKKRYTKHNSKADAEKQLKMFANPNKIKVIGPVPDPEQEKAEKNKDLIGHKKIKEGEERSIIKNACVEKLVDNFAGRENQFQNKEDFEYAIYQQLEDLDVADCVDPDMIVGGQRIGDFASGRVIDCCNSGDIIYDVMANMDLTQIGEDIDKMSMGDTIKDFYKSDAPQFKGKSKKKRRQMAIAAKLAANEGFLNDYNFLSEREELDESVLNLVKAFGKNVGGWIRKYPNLATWLGVGGISVYGILPAATNWARENMGLIGLFAVGGVGLSEYLRRTGMSRQEAKKAQAEWELNHKKKVAKELAPIIGKDAAFPEIGQEKDKEVARADRKIAQGDKKVQQFKAVTS